MTIASVPSLAFFGNGLKKVIASRLPKTTVFPLEVSKLLLERWTREIGLIRTDRGVLPIMLQMTNKASQWGRVMVDSIF